MQSNHSKSKERAIAFMITESLVKCSKCLDEDSGLKYIFESCNIEDCFEMELSRYCTGGVNFGVTAMVTYSFVIL